MRIWGSSSSDISPSSSPLAEKTKAKTSKSSHSAHHRSASSSELEPLPVVSGLSSTDCDDTTKDDDSKYAVNPELLKEELREGREVADATSSEHPSSNHRIEADENSEREAPKLSSSPENCSSGSQEKHHTHPPKTDSRQSEESATTGKSKKGRTLSRMLFSASSKDAQQPAFRDQVKVIYRQFGPDAAQVLTVEHDAGGMPSPNAADHVVVKIQVRSFSFPI